MISPPRIVDDAASAHSAAIVTASYGPDFERCRLLCETIDAHVTGMAHHYILVAHHDVQLFRQLEGPRRSVVDERDLLPSWLHALPDPTSLFTRRIWLSTRTMPLRGWHVQQLRRIALHAKIDEDALIYVDSDVAFIKAFDCRTMWQDDKLQLFRRENGLAQNTRKEHFRWSSNAALALGIEPPTPSPHDYIVTLIAWRRQSIQAMCERIEAVHGRHWVEVLGSQRQFSECTIYGRYVDEIEGLDHHYHSDRELCRVYWSGPELSAGGLQAFVSGMAAHQVAIGIQSFTGTDINQIRATL
ncbi:DUF6492 family protein [Tianweitania sp.]|uniref:DUF6492 family protein n=1 Tax=Tianweitania sp. TaxID=2021634 RepID=UPI0028A03977|nr:DUF6492 family protein [Tianweitania sp.]